MSANKFEICEDLTEAYLSNRKVLITLENHPPPHPAGIQLTAKTVDLGLIVL